MHDFRRLHVWQRARELAVAVHGTVRRFPRSDNGVIAAQLRRSALGIPANIAEGCGKASRKETVRFLNIAAGSAAETESHLLVASDLGYIHPRLREELLGDVKAVQRMLVSLMDNLPP